MSKFLIEPWRQNLSHVALSLGVVGFVSSGCRPPAPPAAAPHPATAGQVRAVDPAEGTPPLGVGLELDGLVGFVRTTLVIEQLSTLAVGTSSRSALYDTPFPVGSEARLRVEVTPPVAPATAPRVTFRVVSGGVVSESFVEPKVPFFAPGTTIIWQPGLAEGQPIPDGAEVEVGRWRVTVDATTTQAIVRLVASRQPTSPRLKGASSSAR